jgi:hypothetical protein
LLVAVVFANGRAVVACVLAIKCQKKCFGGSLASTLANILGISEYTGYFRILGPQLLEAVVFASCCIPLRVKTNQTNQHLST